MVTRPTKLMPDEAKELVQKALTGQLCTLQRVDSEKSLFIGFGDVDNTRTIPNAKTQIGTYYCSWRVSREGNVLCVRGDELGDLQDCWSGINLGEFKAISHLSEFDIRLEFSTGICVDVLCTISYEDEVIHIFLPDKKVLTFEPIKGWQFGRSDQPWS